MRNRTNHAVSKADPMRPILDEVSDWETSIKTYDDGSDRWVKWRSLADLDFVNLLLEHGAASIRSWYDIHLDDSLRVPAAIVSRLHSDAVLFTGVQFANRLDYTRFRINLKLLQTVIWHVVDAVSYLCIRTFIVVGRFHLLISKCQLTDS